MSPRLVLVREEDSSLTEWAEIGQSGEVAGVSENLTAVCPVSLKSVRGKKCEGLSARWASSPGRLPLSPYPVPELCLLGPMPAPKRQRGPWESRCWCGKGWGCWNCSPWLWTSRIMKPDASFKQTRSLPRADLASSWEVHSQLQPRPLPHFYEKEEASRM